MIDWHLVNKDTGAVVAAGTASSKSVAMLQSRTGHRLVFGRAKLPSVMSDQAVENSRRQAIRRKAARSIDDIAPIHRQLNLMSRQIELLADALADRIPEAALNEIREASEVLASIRAIAAASNEAERAGISADDWNPETGSAS